MTEVQGSAVQPDSVRDVLAFRLSHVARIDDAFRGACGPGRFAAESPMWPGDRWRTVTAGRVIHDDDRTVEEYVFEPASLDEPVVPLAVVWDGAGAAHVRLYYSMRLFGLELTRLPIVDVDAALHVDNGLARYFSALAAGDPAALRASVADGYSFRDPSGAVRHGEDDVRALFAALAARGGIRLAPCTLTQDPTTAAVEFVSASTNPPHAGLANYDRAPDGRLAAARVYE